jgi:dihydrodipicolinate synthase/N-acetylneuraminate lyase
MMSVQYIVRRAADASTITRLAVSHGRVRGIREARVDYRRLRVAREDKGYMDVGCCVDTTLCDTRRGR